MQNPLHDCRTICTVGELWHTSCTQGLLRGAGVQVRDPPSTAQSASVLHVPLFCSASCGATSAHLLRHWPMHATSSAPVSGLQVAAGVQNVLERSQAWLASQSVLLRHCPGCRGAATATAALPVTLAAQRERAGCLEKQLGRQKATSGRLPVMPLLYDLSQGALVMVADGRREKEVKLGCVIALLPPQNSPFFPLFIQIDALVLHIECGVVWCGVVWCGRAYRMAAQTAAGRLQMPGKAEATSRSWSHTGAMLDGVSIMLRSSKQAVRMSCGAGWGMACAQ